MNHHDISGLISNQAPLTRRLFAGGTLATLAAAGFSIPAAAQGLKGLDEDDQTDRDEDDEAGDIPETWEEIGITSDHTYESPSLATRCNGRRPGSSIPRSRA